MLLCAVCVKDKALPDRPALLDRLERLGEGLDAREWQKAVRLSNGIGVFCATHRWRKTENAVLTTGEHRWVMAPYSVVGQTSAAPRPALIEDSMPLAAIAASCLPPFVAVATDFARGRLQVATDWLGFGRVFCLDRPDLTIVANRLQLIQQVAGAPLPLDDEALAGFAASGWFMEHATPLAGVKVLPPSSMLTVEAGRGAGSGSALTRRPLPLAVPGEAIVTREILETTAHDLIATARQVGACLGGSVSLSFSGGKDSRLLAAVLLAAGLEVRFFTRAEYPDEVVIARTLTSRIPGGASHEISGESEATDATALVDPEASARYLVAFSGGMYDTGYVGEAAPGSLGEAGVGRRPTIHGGLGSGQGFYYPKQPKESYEEAEIVAHLRSRILGKPKMLTAFAGERSGEAFARVFAEAKACGFHDMRIGDWFYLFERFRRWSPIPSYLNYFVPFASVGFLNAKLALAETEIRAASLHRALSAMIMPQWADVPYFKVARRGGDRPVRSKVRLDAKAMRRILDNDRVRRLYRPDRLEAALRNVAEHAETNYEEKVIQRCFWIMALEEEFGTRGAADRAAISPLRLVRRWLGSRG